MRIVLGGVAPLPYRVAKAEAALRGRRLDEESARAAGAAAVDGARPLAKKGYKVPLTQAVVTRALLSLAQAMSVSRIWRRFIDQRVSHDVSCANVLSGYVTPHQRPAHLPPATTPVRALSSSRKNALFKTLLSAQRADTRAFALSSAKTFSALIFRRSIQPRHAGGSTNGCGALPRRNWSWAARSKVPPFG